MDWSDDEVEETSSHEVNASEALHHTYEAIKTQLGDDDESDEPSGKLSRVSATVDQVPDISHVTGGNETTIGIGVNNPKVAMEDSVNFRETCDAVTKKLYGNAISALPNSIDDITALLLSSLDKRNGDELSEGQLGDLIQLWQLDIKPVNESTPRVGTFDIAICPLPHDLTLLEFDKLRKKMNVKSFANQAERQMFIERLNRMERDEVHRYLTVRRSMKQEGGTKQNVDDNTGEAVVNRDEREQARILRCLCDHFQRNNIGPEPQPISYWSFIMSDDYAETVENAFYMSFLVRLEVIQLWRSDDYQEVVFVPNFETIDKSKFGTKSARSRRKKDIAAYDIMSQHVRQASLKLLEEKRTVDKELTKKNKRHEQKYDMPSAEVRLQLSKLIIKLKTKASRQGMVNLTTKYWRKAVALLKADAAKNGKPWVKYIASRSEN